MLKNLTGSDLKKKLDPDLAKVSGSASRLGISSVIYFTRRTPLTGDGILVLIIEVGTWVHHGTHKQYVQEVVTHFIWKVTI